MMFAPSDVPRVFGVAPGEDFPEVLLRGIEARLRDKPPQELARVEIFVNTRRMQRRLKSLFEDGPARLLPRIRLITDLANDVGQIAIPSAGSALQRRLELSQLISKLLETDPNLAPRSSLFDLSDSLAALMEEMDGEGVSPDVLAKLDVSDASGHWQRALQFINLIQPFVHSDIPSLEARQRQMTEAIVSKWGLSPPSHPILVAGSTGSRGATAILMDAVARLPQGAVVLPGYDFDLPKSAWEMLAKSTSSEDHPQFRFAKLMHRLSSAQDRVAHWLEDFSPSPRNRLISLSLRPAPVTDQWLTEGRDLHDLDTATKDVSLIEAPSPRSEAVAISLILREAVENGVSAALISPDRTLTRRVAAALDRWRILPDDSAGMPLNQSPPGRLLRQVSSLFGQKMTSDRLLALLKHPLVATGGEDRGSHLLQTRELELWLRRHGSAYLDSSVLRRWAFGSDQNRLDWVSWLEGILSRLSHGPAQHISVHLRSHIAVVEAICAGSENEGSGDLWKEAPGKAARSVIEELREQAGSGGEVSAQEYDALIQAVLSGGQVRQATVGHPDVAIWGTLEARVQGAELVILAGLNEGVWPSAPRPDPWLNRVMRSQAGLLSPEREIGLAAHDYQQAVCARSVVLSRSIRDAEAQTVPSRWLNRLTNLLGGLEQGGARALEEMRARGARWLKMADALERPDTETTPAKRPSPCPPTGARPKEISITEVQTLIRDPYAVYARRILGLGALDPLVRQPDAPLRGTIIHDVFHKWISRGLSGDAETDKRLLLEIAEEVMNRRAGWPAARLMWFGLLERIADWVVAEEHRRQTHQTPAVQEARGDLLIGPQETRLYGTLDRVDRMRDGRLSIYDYKTGAIPTADQRAHFDKQLFLSALMVSRGNVEGLVSSEIDQVGYIGLGSKPKLEIEYPEKGDLETVYEDLNRLLSAYAQPDKGYVSRRAAYSRDRAGDYDHLARFGEWDESTEPTPEDVG